MHALIENSSTTDEPDQFQSVHVPETGSGRSPTLGGLVTLGKVNLRIGPGHGFDTEVPTLSVAL